MDDASRRLTKAYNDPAFLSGREARPLRILAEYLEPKARFDEQAIQDTIVFFGSARLMDRDAAEARLQAAKAGDGDVAEAEMRLHLSTYYEAARELAKRLTKWSMDLPGEAQRFVVCTGGGPGIMEAANRGAAEAGGKNIGLTISLPIEEFENAYVSERLGFEFHYFFMRKFWFTYMAKAIIAMPGGFGTLDELFEILTLIQTLKIKKRLPIVLFGSEYWSEVINFDALVRFGTINADDLDLFHHTDSIDDAFDYVTRELTAHALEDPGPTL